MHIINRLPSPLLKSKFPSELLFKEPPSMIHLKLFGCLSYATPLQALRTKFQPRARRVVFLSYKEGTKGFILYDLDTHTIFISTNVGFYETTFPFQPHNSPHNIHVQYVQNLNDPHVETSNLSHSQ